MGIYAIDSQGEAEIGVLPRCGYMMQDFYGWARSRYSLAVEESGGLATSHWISTICMQKVEVRMVSPADVLRGRPC